MNEPLGEERASLTRRTRKKPEVPDQAEIINEELDSEAPSRRLADFGPKLRALPVKVKIIVAALLSVLLGAGIYLLATMPDRNYLQQISEAKLGKYFANDNVALAQGKSFCDGLRGGSDAIGFHYQQIAVKNFCVEYLEGFEVIPTPEEQQETLVRALREKDLAGTFSSELDAVNKAKAVCANLDSGGEQEGPLVEFIAVSVYCNKYENGFRTLKDVKVKATLTLTESDPFGSWFPAIARFSNGSCTGQYGYRDINSSTVVTVRNQDGVELASTTLGKGKGTYYKCVFTYTFKVLEGEKYYMVAIGTDRGSLRYTESQLKIPGELNSGFW
jgi:hypothetical protein